MSVAFHPDEYGNPICKTKKPGTTWVPGYKVNLSKSEENLTCYYLVSVMRLTWELAPAVSL